MPAWPAAERFPPGTEAHGIRGAVGVLDKIMKQEMPGGVAATVAIREFAADDAAVWDAFVATHPGASFFHLSAWRQVIERAFGHRTHFLLSRRGKDVTGILPLALVRSALFGRALISTPFCVYGGPLASDAASRTALEQAACALAREFEVDYLELRNREPGGGDWLRKNLYVTFRKEIPTDPESILAMIPRKQRAVIRKGTQGGLVAQIDFTSERLYAAYSESARNLGTPVFARRYLDILLETFGKQVEILTITKAGRPVSSVLSFYFRDEILPYYGGGTRAARALCANDFMYWEVMSRAAQRGVRVFDYGRSKLDSGSYHFKRHWGFEPTPLAYEYYLVGARSVPNLSPNNPKYRALINVWQRLPVWSTRLLGPHIARHLG